MNVRGGRALYTYTYAFTVEWETDWALFEDPFLWPFSPQHGYVLKDDLNHVFNVSCTHTHTHTHTHIHTHTHTHARTHARTHTPQVREDKQYMINARSIVTVIYGEVLYGSVHVAAQLHWGVPNDVRMWVSRGYAGIYVCTCACACGKVSV